MASDSTIPPDAILNPYTVLAFMPPDVADQYQVICYVYVATLAVGPRHNAEQQSTSPQTPYRLTRGIG